MIPPPPFVAGPMMKSMIRGSGIGCGRARMELDKDMNDIDDDADGLDEHVGEEQTSLLEKEYVDPEESEYFAPRATFDDGRHTGRSTFRSSRPSSFVSDPMVIKRISFHAMNDTEKGRDTLKRLFGSGIGNSDVHDVGMDGRFSFDELAEDICDHDLVFSDSDVDQLDDFSSFPMLLGKVGANMRRDKAGIDDFTSMQSEEDWDGRLMSSTPLVSTTASLLRTISAERSRSSACDVAAMTPSSLGEFSSWYTERVGEDNDIVIADERRARSSAGALELVDASKTDANKSIYSSMAFAAMSALTNDKASPSTNGVGAMRPSSAGQIAQKTVTRSVQAHKEYEERGARSDAVAFPNSLQRKSTSCLESPFQAMPPSTPMPATVSYQPVAPAAPKPDRPWSSTRGRPNLRAQTITQPPQNSSSSAQVDLEAQGSTGPMCPRKKPQDSLDGCHTKSNDGVQVVQGASDEAHAEDSAKAKVDQRTRVHVRVEQGCTLSLTCGGELDLDIAAVPASSSTHLVKAGNSQDASLRCSSREDE